MLFLFCLFLAFVFSTYPRSLARLFWHIIDAGGNGTMEEKKEIYFSKEIDKKTYEAIMEIAKKTGDLPCPDELKLEAFKAIMELCFRR